MDDVFQAISDELRRRGDGETAASQEKYMKGVVRFHGLKAPLLREVTKGLSPLWKGQSTKARIDLSGRLLRSPFFEEKDVGIAILQTLKKTLDATWLKSIEPGFGDMVCGWATCDTLCGAVFRYLLPDDEMRRILVSWKDSADPWLQRAAAVSFVNEAKHGLYNEEVLEICAATVRNPYRFVQLGTGWVLRELSLVDRPRVTAFLVANRDKVSAEGLRYALEKYPVEERTAFYA